MWLGDVLQSKVMVKHSAAILLYGFVSGSGNSTRGTWSELLEVRLGNICKGGRLSDSKKRNKSWLIGFKSISRIRLKLKKLK